MAFVRPIYTNADVNRAGKILASDNPDDDDWIWAYYDVLANWRACHGYPINTFQSLLRMRIKLLDKNAIVAQRLKRAPSVISKLQRFKSMKLSQMQDIGGLRAVVSSIPRVRKLEELYRNSSFKHELVSSKNYIDTPKPDGYRSIHLVYRYRNDHAPHFNGLLLELQLRTGLQHAWATAVETMSTFLGQALKSGQGDENWRSFFEVASAAFSFLEGTAPVPGYEKFSRQEVFTEVARAENKLRVLHKLQGFSIAANQITAEKGAGSYHLIVLDSGKRSVVIQPFPKTQLEEASRAYALIEARAKQGEQVEAVLVSAGPVEALMKAYPNYFLDTHQFVTRIGRVIGEARMKGREAKSAKLISSGRK
jgi:putative GTP pyrophosphokinase